MSYRFPVTSRLHFDLFLANFENDISVLSSQLHGLKRLVTSLRYLVGNLDFVLKVEGFAARLQVILRSAFASHVIDQYKAE